jgi:ATP-dependent DNA ligase
MDGFALVPEGCIAQIWTENGIVAPEAGLVTRSIPSYVVTGKNLGKTNETNLLTQAMIQGRSKYLAKTKGHSDRYYPQAVHKYDDAPRDPSRHLVYPLAIQRKFDGGRTVAYLPQGQADVVMYSRRLKDVLGHDHIRTALSDLFGRIQTKYPGVYLDGELYKHGLSLQTISGIMRRKASSKTSSRELRDGVEPIKLEYYIFDVFFVDQARSAMPFVERKRVLDDIMSFTDSSALVKAKTYVSYNEESSDLAYNTFLQEKFEGSIMRNLAAPYEFNSKREIRTYQVRKRKPRYSSEYKVTGFSQGVKGKDRGAIIWELETADGIKFTSTPVGINYDERYKMFKLFTEHPEEFDKYLNKMMTVEYDDISKENVPLRAKAKCLRLIA